MCFIAILKFSIVKRRGTQFTVLSNRSAASLSAKDVRTSSGKTITKEIPMTNTARKTAHASPVSRTG